MQMGETEAQGAQELTAAIEVLVPGRGPTISGSAHKVLLTCIRGPVLERPPEAALGENENWGRAESPKGPLRTACYLWRPVSCEKALCRVPSLCKEAVMTGVNALTSYVLAKTRRFPRQQKRKQHRGPAGRGAGITLSCPAPVDRGPSAPQSHNPIPPTRCSPPALPEQGWESQGHGGPDTWVYSGSVLDSCALMRGWPRKHRRGRGKPGPGTVTYTSVCFRDTAAGQARS